MLISLVCYGICIYLGFAFSSQIKKEKKLLMGIIRFNKSMIINLEHNKKTIMDFIKEYNDSDVKKVLNSYVKQLKNGSTISVDIKDKTVKLEVETYFQNLGKSNSNSQIDYAKGYEKIFQMYYDEFCVAGNKKISLYPKLGILLGGIVFIMLL